MVALVVAVIAYNGLRRAGQFGAAAQHAVNVRSALSTTMLGLDDAETGQRGFLLTGDSAYLDPLARGKRMVPAALADLTSLLRSDPHEEAVADTLGSLASEKFAIIDRTIQLHADSGRPAAIAVVLGGRGKAVMDESRQIVNTLSQQEDERLMALSATEERERDAAGTVLFAGIGIAVLLGLLANVRVVRESHRLSATVAERDTANAALRDQATELEATNDELTRSASSLQEQAIELEQQTEEAQSLAEELELTNDELGRANDELVERSRAAARAEDVATSASKAKSDFLAMMSHEIRTPINAVVGYSELLSLGLSGPLTEEQRSHVQRIQESTRHLLHLVNEVLDLAKIESGTLHVEAGHGEVGQTIAAAVDLVRTQAHAKQITIVERLNGLGAVTYQGDEDRVKQVMLNLLSNAIKFTLPGGAVTISASLASWLPDTEVARDGACIAVTVADSGIGISPDDFERIFEPFTQIEPEGRNAYTREQTGTGLGLPISRQLAGLMGGTLTVSSIIGSGSEFTLRLPVGTTQAQPAASPPSQTTPQA